MLRREPDLVLMCGPHGSVRGCFVSGHQMLANPRFLASYFPVTFEGNQPYTLRSRIWVRREGGKLGIQREPGRVVVPGWLLAGNRVSVVCLGPDGRPGVSANGQSPAHSLILPLPTGRWKVQVEGSSYRHVVTVLDADRKRLIATALDDGSFTANRGSSERIRLAVAPFPDTTALVYRVVLERQGGDSASTSIP